jgi:hypothetical protein
VQAIDNNFAKLAAKGITIIFASGDSGSGYTVDPSCTEIKGIGLKGEVLRTLDVYKDASHCCEEATAIHGAGWTFVFGAGTASSSDRDTLPVHPPMPDTDPKLRETNLGPPLAYTYSFNNSEWHTTLDDSGRIRPQNVLIAKDLVFLTGDIDGSGGTVLVKNGNGTWPDVNMTFGPLYQPSQFVYSDTTATINGVAFHGKMGWVGTPFEARPASTGQTVHPLTCEDRGGEFCYMQLALTKHYDDDDDDDDIPLSNDCALWQKGPNPYIPPNGLCTIYKTVTSNTTANSSTSSSAPDWATPELWPSWPASSPWVTSVGATRFVGHKVGSAEKASDQFGSGGGFSKQFSQSPNAEWQSAAVAKYLATVDPSTLPAAGLFPPKGRATPDVSALGEGYQVFNGGWEVVTVGGTSASAPAFAAMVSLLNEARIKAGKPAMGFLNPFLYANADAFTDIVMGSNKISREGNEVAYGFNCTKGWDPVTGLGTPQFGKLLAAAVA